MGEIGRELGETGEGTLEPIEHVVEGDRDRLQLARPFRRRDSLVQSMRTDSLERLGHRRQGLQTAFRDRDRDHDGSENSREEDTGDQKTKLQRETFIFGAVLRYLNDVTLAVDLFMG